MNDLVDTFRDLSPTTVAALGAVAAFLTVLAIGVQVSAARLLRSLTQAQEELIDPKTGLLPRSGVRVRLGAEIAWAGTSGTPIAIAELRVRGSRFAHAARVLRHLMREEESAFLIGDQRVAIELWDADQIAAEGATKRIGTALARAGHPVVDVGLACSPRDGSDVETLLAVARRDLRPADDPRATGRPLSAQSRPRTPLTHLATQLAGIAPWLVAMGLVLVFALQLIGPALEAANRGERTGSELIVALVTGLGIPLAAAFMVAAAWNLGGGAAPRSRPMAPAGRAMLAAVAAIVGVPLALAISVPDLTASIDGIGAILSLMAIVILVLAQARQFVHLHPLILVGMAALGAAMTWVGVEHSTLPLLANIGRLLVAAGLGALLASLVERASWLVVLAVGAGAIDAWSVWSAHGITNQLLAAERGGSSSRLTDLVLFTGPEVDTGVLFAVGTTDLVFIALFLAWSHDWRLDMRIAIGALIAGAWGTFALSELLGGEAVPMLPLLCGAMILVVAARSYLLRTRIAAWSDHQG